jgi:hypothetical protein
MNATSVHLNQRGIWKIKSRRFSKMRITEKTTNNTVWDNINIDPVPVLESQKSIYVKICNWAAAPIVLILFMIIMINIVYGDTISHHNADAITRVNTSGFSSTYIYSDKLKDAIASDLISDDIVAIYKYKNGRYIFSHLEGGDNKIAVHCISYDNGREKITIGLKSESIEQKLRGA